MKIGIDARMFGSRQTGIGNYIKNLTSEIFKLDQKNDYYIFLAESQLKRFSASSPKIHKIKANSHWYSWSEQTRFLLDLLKYKLDLVHFLHFNVPWLYRGKFIVTVHDITQNSYSGSGYSGYLKKLAYRFIFSRAIDRSGAVIAVSDFTKQDLLDNFFGPVGRMARFGKINVIYEGIDPIFKQPASPEEIRNVL